jgi:hypothetical protein
MTLTRLSEIIHKWLGWCPNQIVTPVRRKVITWQEMNSCVPPASGTYANNNVIIDYGKTGISLAYFIGLLVAIIGSIALFVLFVGSGFIPHARLLFWVLVLPVMIAIVYRDLRKAHLEISPDTLIIGRPLHRPVLIPKDSISSLEIRPNEQPFPLRFQKILIVLLALLYAGMTRERYLQGVAGDITVFSFFLNLGSDIGTLLFFLALYHHSRIRADYPELLVITTNTQRRIAIYGKNYGEIVKMLGKSV